MPRCEVEPIVNDPGHLRLEGWEPIPSRLFAPIELNRHGVSDRSIVWKATTSSGSVAVRPTQLPFRDETFAHVTVADLLEYVRDEHATLAEVARVSTRRGRLTLLTPYLGTTTWLDGANWHRYLHDLTGSDAFLPELAESGWRRRYRRSDLESLLAQHGFELRASDRRGTGLSELGWFVARLLERRSPAPGSEPDLDLIRIRHTARALDRRIPLGPLGSWLIIEAVKTEKGDKSAPERFASTS